MELREYQQRAIDQLYEWLRNNPKGYPCLVLPTGSGKSHIVAALCKDALQAFPETRVLMMTHVKELIEQNAEKMRFYWPNAPMGIYSAGMGKRELSEPITFGGIQSLRGKADRIGHVDLVIIDEAHLVSHKQEGTYRTLLDELTEINPQICVIGLTATPYRLGHGLITDGDALFDDLIEPTSIEELVHKGYLAPLRSKVVDAKLDVSGVHKRGGEYIESELQEAVNTDAQNAGIVDEVIARADGRKSWLFFCSGIAHAEAVRDMLTDRGITAACVTGGTPKSERAQIIDDYKAGKITALTNANVLTTGFDYPDIDLIAMARPTMSPGLYVQMAGRGLRPKSHTDHCLVLDFAGVVAQHGPITAVQPPGKSGTGEAPTKTCPGCGEICHASLKDCPVCGHVFYSEKEPPKLQLRNDDIMGMEAQKLDVTEWRVHVHESRTSGIPMIFVRYYGGLMDTPVDEYIGVLHPGRYGDRSRGLLASMANNAGFRLPQSEGDLESVCEEMMLAKPPSSIAYHREGRFFRIVKREWL